MMNIEEVDARIIEHMMEAWGDGKMGAWGPGAIGEGAEKIESEALKVFVKCLNNCLHFNRVTFREVKTYREIMGYPVSWKPYHERRT
jgi:hypothetical protein